MKDVSHRILIQNSKDILLFFCTCVMFLLSLFFVFCGFVGYYTRINLTNEFVNDKVKNIDVVFAQIEQLKLDEKTLDPVRIAIRNIYLEQSAEKIEARAELYGSEEFKLYADALFKLIETLRPFKDQLRREYWQSVLNISLTSPELEQTQRVLNIEYIENSKLSDAQRAELEQKLSSIFQNLRDAMTKFHVKSSAMVLKLERPERLRTAPLFGKMIEILSRNPQLATRDELAFYKIPLTVDGSTRSDDLARQRAAVEAVVWPARVILQWSTIASTLIVTLATGWLAGIINFMQVAAHTGRATTPTAEQFQEPDFIGLVRRSFLGLAAALAIFLFAGSGLLALNVQSGRSIGANPLELSPYFVAFLAFISGFLADDAFARLTKAGKPFFRGGEDKKDEKRDARNAGAGEKS